MTRGYFSFVVFVFKHLIYRSFLELGQAQNFYNFVKAAIDAEFLFQDRHEQVNADRDPYLRLHGVRARAEKRFDPQVLLDPFETLSSHSL